MKLCLKSPLPQEIFISENQLVNLLILSLSFFLLSFFLFFVYFDQKYIIYLLFLYLAKKKGIHSYNILMNVKCKIIIKNKNKKEHCSTYELSP